MAEKFPQIDTALLLEETAMSQISMPNTMAEIGRYIHAAEVPPVVHAVNSLSDLGGLTRRIAEYQRKLLH